MFKKVRVTRIALLMVVALMFTGCFGLFKVPEPSFEVTGVEDGEVYTEPVTPVINAGKGTTLTITLNDEEFASGTEITEPGTYELIIVGENKKGETVSDTINFTISEYPKIAVTGVEDGKQYIGSVTPEIATDDETDTVEITLNDEPYTSGTEITAPGIYKLVVEATNTQENKSTVSLTFSVYDGKKLTIDENMTGISHEKGTSVEINEDAEFIKTGERSIKFVNQADTKSCLRIQRSPHPDWPADWTQFERMSFWIYFDDVDSLNNVEYILSTPAGEKKKSWAKDDLVNGWNYCEVNIPELAGDDLDKLVNMDDVSDNKGSYFLDIAVRTPENVITVYFDDFIFWCPLPTE